MQRSFLGEIRTLRPCAACRGFGSVIPDPCRECSGDGRVRSRRTLTVKIPAGVDTGTRVQLAEEGEVGPGGGPAGDLYVEITVARHQTFTRHGNDLHCTVTLPMTAAALGHDADAADARGRRRATARARRPTSRRPSTSRSGPAPSPAPSRCCGAAACPGLRGGRGDLVVTIAVETPTRLDPRQEELLRELAAIRGEEQPDASVRPGQQVGLRPAARRVQPALTPQPMSLHVHLVPSLAGVGAGLDGDRRGRRGAPRRRRTPDRGSGSGRCSPTGRGAAAAATVASTGKRGARRSTSPRSTSVPAARAPARRSCRRCPRATAASSRWRC